MLKRPSPGAEGRHLPSSRATERGTLVAGALAGAWRRSPPPLTLSPAALVEIAPVLLATGAGGLGWWRIRHSPGPIPPAAAQLQQAYRLQTLLAPIHERQLLQALAMLGSAGVEPLLVKGWAVARLYPEPGLRPYGDIDLFVRPEQHAAAATALADLIRAGCPVDLHGDTSLGVPVAEMYRRASRLPLGEAVVQVLGPEDHLRFLCRHLLAHGAWRPLWLCDVAALLESRPAGFDWGYFLTASHRRSDGIAWTLALARAMLDARLEGTPWERQTTRLPRWFVAAVLRSWGTAHHHREPLAHHLRQRTGVLGSLRQSWPDPITATAELRAPFNHLPRLPFQLAFCLKRSAQIALELLTEGRGG